MASKNPMDYLERKKRFLTPAGRGRFATDALHSHFRPVPALPDLLPEDSPAHRVITQKENERVAYIREGPGPELD